MLQVRAAVVWLTGWLCVCVRALCEGDEWLVGLDVLALGFWEGWLLP